MIVADSSYLVKRLLEQRGEWGAEDFVAPDFAVPEVVNAVLAQQRVFHSVKDGLPYITSFFEAMDASSLRLVEVTESLSKEAYDIALRNNETVYDCIFVALALRSGAPLKTDDSRQARAYAKESALGTRRGKRTDWVVGP